MDEKPKSRFPGSAVWTAIFTGVLTIVAVLQYLVYRKANGIEVATQRAFIGNSGPGNMGKTLSSDGKDLVGYTLNSGWGNSGTTPSKVATLENNIAFVERSPDEGTDFSKLQQAAKKKYVFGAHQFFTVAGIPVGIGDLEEVAAGKKHIIVWGWAVYRDIFPETPARLSEYCYDVTNPRWNKPVHSDPTTDMAVDNPPCEVHNCYDEECPDYKQRVEEAETFGKSNP